MAPAVRVSSSSAPRSLRSPPRSAAPAGQGRAGWEGGARAAPPGPLPAFPGPGGASIRTPTPRGRGSLRAGRGVSFRPHPIFPCGGWGAGEGSASRALWPGFVARSGSEMLGRGDGSWPRAWLAAPYFGEKESGATTPERSPPRGEGEAQQTPTPPKCIRWRKDISSGEQIECIKLA